MVHGRFFSARGRRSAFVRTTRAPKLACPHCVKVRTGVYPACIYHGVKALTTRRGPRSVPATFTRRVQVRGARRF